MHVLHQPQTHAALFHRVQLEALEARRYLLAPALSHKVAC